MGEQLLESSYMRRWQKQQQGETQRLRTQLHRIVRGCTTVSELGTVVREAAPHMTPDTLVTAVSKATHLPLVRILVRGALSGVSCIHSIHW